VVILWVDLLVGSVSQFLAKQKLPSRYRLWLRRKEGRTNPKALKRGLTVERIAVWSAPSTAHDASRLAPVAELVDALDSKSSSQKECQFESGQGHHFLFALGAMRLFRRNRANKDAPNRGAFEGSSFKAHHIHLALCLRHNRGSARRFASRPHPSIRFARRYRSVSGSAGATAQTDGSARVRCLHPWHGVRR
jgi:hypothetical protein